MYRDMHEMYKQPLFHFPLFMQRSARYQFSQPLSFYEFIFKTPIIHRQILKFSPYNLTHDSLG